MPEITGNCPRCGIMQITFDITGSSPLPVDLYNLTQRREIQCRCRQCQKSSLFVVGFSSPAARVNLEETTGGIMKANGLLDAFFSQQGFVNTKDNNVAQPPADVPAAIHNMFLEGATCVAVGCYNAAGTMFRMCLDLTTKALLPEGTENGLTSQTRRSLGLRLRWLIKQNFLPKALEDLSICVKEDGNDGAHDGTLGKSEAEDLQDFTTALLERLYSEPAKLQRAAARREERRAK